MNYGKKLLIVFVVAVTGLVAALYLYTGKERGTAGEKTLTLYCAAGVKPPVLAAVKEFSKRYGVTVNLQYGGSGTLLSNLQVAKQGDLYLAGDSSYIELGREKGVVLESLPLAHMTPVIAVQKGNPKKIKSLSDLSREDVRLALGNPDAASIGKQAKKLLTQAGHWKSVKARVETNGVFKPTVPEVANDIKIGAVDAGVIWDATVNQYPELEAVHVPSFDRARKKITIGVLKWSQKPTLALRFARFLNSDEGNRFFENKGYPPVEGDKWEWQPQITFFCGAVNRRAVAGIVEEFSKREGVEINTIYNGCGILTGQMRTIRQTQGGAGFPDIYLACDRFYLDNVKEWFQEDLDISDTPIVIAVQKGNPSEVSGIADLTKPGMKVAVGQCEQCTIGALTKILLEKEGVYDKVKSNVVAETASSALLVPTVATKSVDAAFAYKTDTQAEAQKVDSVEIPSNNALAIQPFAIAVQSRYKHLGRRFKARLVAGREAFEAAGFHFRADDGVSP